MAAPTLGDPILNDLSLMVQGKKKDFSHQTVTRYLTHLQRLDGELKDARKGSGNIAIGINSEVVKISSERLRATEQELAHLRQALVNTTEQALAYDKAGQALKGLEQALFEEFGDDLATVDGQTSTDIVLGLLRKWRPSAEKSPEGHERHDPPHAGDPTGSVGTVQGDPATGAGAPSRGTSTRRAR